MGTAYADDLASLMYAFQARLVISIRNAGSLAY